MGYEIVKIDEKTFRVEDNNTVRFFLLIGDREALLIDSGMEISNAKEIAKNLTSLPLKLLNTHADRDHLGSVNEFDTFYMHPLEEENFINNNTSCREYIKVEHGDIIDLGNRPLEIILISGHTPGSVAILDINNRVLFSGDSVQAGTIFMFGKQRNIDDYLNSLKKLTAYKDRFDTIYPSHGLFPVDPELIDKLYYAVIDILNGKYEPTKENVFGNTVNLFDVGIAKFLMEIENQ